MSSNGETLSEKPKGVDADSFPGPIKPTGTSYVSSGLSNSDPHSKKTKSEASVSSGLTKPSGKTGVSSGLSIGVPNSKNPDCTKTGVSLGVRGKAAVSSRAKGKAIVSAKAVEVMSFKDVKFGPHGCELRFRLIHLWEARNVVTKMLIGLEMLLIDQEGFIPAGRIDTYLPHMKVGGIYRLNKDSSVCFPEDRFRFHGYEEFDAACDLRGDLYDYVGHIKLVNGQACFVLLGDAGQELTGKKASELVDSYFEANENMGDDHLVPVPQALINTIGQTRKFIVKNGVAEDGPSTRFEESGGERVKRTADNVEAEDSKRAKCG
ncbi:hypothetical protein YC2023_094706 [Brassica napus]